MKGLVLVGLAAISLYVRAEAANIRPEQRRGGLGGTYIHIAGEILPDDQDRFETAALTSERPVYVIPTGPGGDAKVGLAIADMIA